jgi:uncharacterized protein YndB with AHSA1/START domain
MKTEHNELKVELKGETEVVVTRYFSAPRELVFDCHTKPELMRRWLVGPDGMVLETCENDLKVGGKYLYVYVNAKGDKFGIYGKFREVSKPERIANTENYVNDMATFDANAPEDPNATVESRTFTAEGNGTLMTHVSKFSSEEVRKMVLESGSLEGWNALCQELDKLLLELV